ncbi:transmembrane protein 45b [Plakobranchus ocellatus]|uniref:Transmembrane protein 45b n=1 Tax=Plakobranchus ocellatus TaxID=259542 RepID=A0AAV4DDC5_9GAST|nr:transmembrane protein 45b [Plakobranchus ocellatus]
MEHLEEHDDFNHAANMDALLPLNSSATSMLNATAEQVPGTILGHVIASLSWFTIGFMYVVMALRRYYTCRQRGLKFVSSVEFPLDFLQGRLKNVPAIALFKLIGAFVFLVSALLAEIEPGTMEEVGQWQHDLMSIAFIISGLIDIITSSCHARRIIPDGVDYAAFALTFFIEFQQFVVHLNERQPVDVRLHELMAFTAILGGLSLVVEAKYRRHVMMPVIRGYFIMLQGTWVMNLMVVLYHPGYKEAFWDPYSHNSVDIVSLMFAWHMFLDMVLVLCINLCLVWVYSQPQYKIVPHSDSCKLGRKWQLLSMERLKHETLFTHGKMDADMNGHREHTLEDIDCESELEFQRPEPSKLRN